MDHNFTVITTCFNDAAFVIPYLDGIVNQSLVPHEIVIVDGGSEDNTKEIIEDYAKKCKVPIRLVCKGRLNIAEAFNIGIKNSDSQYVLISCIGNQFSSTMCEDLYNSIIKTNSDAAFGLLFGVDKGKFSKMYNLAFIGEKGMAIMSNRSVMYNKSVFEKIGYFIETFRYAGEDSEFLNRFVQHGLSQTIVQKPTVFWETPDSWSEYLKQCKNYAIAELQHEEFSRCLATSQMKRWYIILLLLLLSPISICFGFLGMLFLLFKLVRSTRRLKYFKVALLYESWTILRIYYSIKYIKFCFPKYRVNKFNL